MAHVPLGDAGRTITPYPFILVLGQDDNELIMGEKLNELGVQVQWNTELVDFTQHADHVAATLKTPDGGSRTLTAAYIAGCDGAHSAVRKLSDIDFPGAPYEHVFLRRRCRDDRHDDSRKRSTSISGAQASTCSSRCAARITGASSASCRRNSGAPRISTSMR